MQLNAKLIEAFAGTFLSHMYDNPKPTPDFHRQGWELYASDYMQVALAAPRGHAKSMGFTHDYVLAEVLFRASEYVIIVSANEEMAIEHLGDIARELSENEDIIREFGIAGLDTAAKTDIIVNCNDGHQFRIIARGSGQAMRGRKWRGKRPGLIVCDDLETDEQTESKDRRDKFRRWFYRALIPCLRNGGRIRIHGTILHEDSLLARIMKDKTWKTLFFKAHESFDDFSNILWPEQWSEERLRAVRQSFIEQYDAAGYSQEFLNNPLDNSEAYLRSDDFIAMNADDLDRDKKICVGVDFAVSKRDKANRSSFTVGGQDKNNILHIIDQYVGRWDILEIVEMMFDINKRYNPELFFVEDGVIWKSLEPILNKEMLTRGTFINCKAIPSTKDKATRGRSLQRRMRAGGMKFNKEASWYAAYEDEMLRFTGTSDATLDDQFDSTALLSKGFDEYAVLDEEDFMDEDEWFSSRQENTIAQGRNHITGY